jgi:hypothetical protein
LTDEALTHHVHHWVRALGELRLHLHRLLLHLLRWHLLHLRHWAKHIDIVRVVHVIEQVVHFHLADTFLF